MVISQLAYTALLRLDEVASEHISLTVGPGFLSVCKAGMPRASLETIRQTILTVRQLLGRNTVIINVGRTHLENPKGPRRVYMTVLVRA